MGCGFGSVPPPRVHSPGGRDAVQSIAAPWRRRAVGEHGKDGEDKDEVAIAEEVAAIARERRLLMSLTGNHLTDLVGDFAPSSPSSRGMRSSSVFSVESMLEKATQSYASKAVASRGDELDAFKEHLGYACKKGHKPESPNQDSFLVCKVPDQFCIYGVFDGHGKQGHDVSNFVKDTLPKVLVTNLRKEMEPKLSLDQAFSTTQRLLESATNIGKLDAKRSGCTATVVLHVLRTNRLYVGHVGDSRCVLARHNELKQIWNASDLTLDHKPNIPEEKLRIEANGGQVRFDGYSTYRVYVRGKKYPGLAMSRAMGDLTAWKAAGVSACPDLLEQPLEIVSPASSPQSARSTCTRTPGEEGRKSRRSSRSASDPAVPLHLYPAGPVTAGWNGARELPTLLGFESGNVELDRWRASSCSFTSHCLDPVGDKFLVICSDGVWDFIDSQEAVEFVAMFQDTQAMEAAEKLVSIAWQRWTAETAGQVVDDITALVVHFPVDEPGTPACALPQMLE
eukprot:TRINITY_DN4369_c0_g2_i1.p1 TRINITY_DN4369_c0_g2~~TRINITY_DN4369_c0_g2_i1.p1  ORF type:complete len:508 (-),score=87.30 TRINITY_DN4369_c0_g2_i1:59-1582(-)